MQRRVAAAHPHLRRQVEIDPENVRRGLGQLVLTIVELLRELLERQAVRRVEAGSLTQAEIERLGLSFKLLKDEMEVLKKHFGLTDEELNLDLGPLGKLF
ncbi:MAG: gas vesicle protein K [Planctomycetota bacterium]